MDPLFSHLDSASRDYFSFLQLALAYFNVYAIIDAYDK